MGCFKSSPYNYLLSFMWGKEVNRGDGSAVNNLSWDHVGLNLPSTDDYTPTEPWVSKRRPDASLAPNFFLYVDDVRNHENTEEESWRVARRAASYCYYLGMQDAPRKCQPPTQIPGAWAGSMVVISDKGIGDLVDDKKWKKVKSQIAEVRHLLRTSKTLPRKRLREIQGFLLYAMWTYPYAYPFLKGLHLTIDRWQGNQDPEGWRMAVGEFSQADGL
jgi:hypothetical protein